MNRIQTNQNKHQRRSGGGEVIHRLLTRAVPKARWQPVNNFG
jgi:hypothetical protein